MSARSVALSSPSSALVSTRVRNSSTCRMFSAAFSSPMMAVVRRSEVRRIAHTSGVTSLTHTVIGAATMRVETVTGAETAIVFGVTSPSRSSKGIMTSTVTTPARSGP